MLIERQFQTGEVTVNYAEGDTVGAPLVLLHGATLHWQDYEPLLPGLEKHWHIYACDLRGHGKSRRASSGYQAVDFIPDTVAFIRSMVSEPVIPFGHSNGGTIALGVAAKIPQLIRAVVLLDPSLSLRDSSLQNYAPYEWLVGVRDILKSVQLPEILIPTFIPDISKTGLQGVTEMIQNVDLASVTVMLNDQFFDGFDLKQVLQNVISPTLLLYGEIDKGSMVRQSDVEFF